jgi:hypothetical protein
MLTIVGNFTFCAFVAEEFDFAVSEFRSDWILKSCFVSTEIFGFRDKSYRDAFDTFGMTEIGRKK